MTEKPGDNLDIDFYDIAARFTEESVKADRPQLILKQFAHLYPQHALDLAAISYARLVGLDKDTYASRAEEEAALIATARRLVSGASSEPSLLISLAAAATAIGFSPHQFAEALRVDLPLLAKLEQRLLIATSIPDTLMHLVAVVLQRSVDEVRAYFMAPPQLAVNARYKSKTRPSVSEANKQSFEQALSASRSLKGEDKSFWLDELKKKDQDSVLD
jgi:hypothetical protein